MKVIGFTGNYGAEEQIPQCYLMADSSILYTGRSFFLPDFAKQFVATPSIVVRTGRLGKCIAPKFAYRYWDAFTAGVSVHAQQGDDAKLTALDRAFDGAAMVGDWVEVASVDDATSTPVVIMVNGEVVSQYSLADMHCHIDELLASVSTRCSIKMGDLLFTGDAGQGHVLSPGDQITAHIGDKQILDMRVKL